MILPAFMKRGDENPVDPSEGEAQKEGALAL